MSNTPAGKGLLERASASKPALPKKLGARMWLVVDPVRELPEYRAWCPVSLHHEETEAKRAAHRRGGGSKAVRALLEFHAPKWEGEP